MPVRGDNQIFDVDYGKASLSISGTGVTIVSTVESYYHGLSMVASAAAMTVNVYNASSGTSTNLVDIMLIAVTSAGYRDKYIPIICRTGITVSVTGTGGNGVIFFSQRG